MIIQLASVDRYEKLQVQSPEFSVTVHVQSSAIQIPAIVENHIKTSVITWLYCNVLSSIIANGIIIINFIVLTGLHH